MKPINFANSQQERRNLLQLSFFLFLFPFSFFLFLFLFPFSFFTCPFHLRYLFFFQMIRMGGDFKNWRDLSPLLLHLPSMTWFALPSSLHLPDAILWLNNPPQKARSDSKHHGWWFPLPNWDCWGQLCGKRRKREKRKEGKEKREKRKEKRRKRREKEKEKEKEENLNRTNKSNDSRKKERFPIKDIRNIDLISSHETERTSFFLTAAMIISFFGNWMRDLACCGHSQLRKSEEKWGKVRKSEEKWEKVRKSEKKWGKEAKVDWFFFFDWIRVLIFLFANNILQMWFFHLRS